MGLETGVTKPSLDWVVGGVRRIGDQDGKRPLSYSEGVALGRLILDVNLTGLGRGNLGESIASFRLSCRYICRAFY